MTLTSEDLELAADSDSVSESMGRGRFQNGWVKKGGKRVKQWTGHWYEYVQVGDIEKRRPRSKVLAPCSKFNNGEGEELLRKLLRSTEPPEDSDSFERFAESYLKTAQGRWAVKTRKTMAAIFKHQINPQLGHRIAAQITKSDVEQALGEIASNPKTQSFSLLEKCLTHIRAVYKMAIEDGRLKVNPTERAQMPNTRRPTERFLTIEQCGKLLTVARGRDRLIIRLFLGCALRPSELFALKDDDVLPGMLRIDAALVLGTVGDTKTEDSRANVPLPATLEIELRAYIRENDICGAYLFATRRGTPIQQARYLDRVLRPLGEAAGIEGLNHQILRRTCATLFQKHGGVKDAQALLRHSNAETTLKHYPKIIDPRLVDAINSLDRQLLGACSQPRLIPNSSTKANLAISCFPTDTPFIYGGVVCSYPLRRPSF